MQRLTGWAALAAAGFALVAMPAHAENFFGDVINEFSLTGPKHAPIDYHERAPLVVPKSLDLPPPEAGNPGTSAANWPKDADDRLSAADREDADPNVPETERWRYKANYYGMYPISPSELEKGRAAMNEVDGPVERPAGYGYYEEHKLTPAELRKGVRKEGAVAAFAGEPSRRRLTDPPTGYRTPAADAPWGPGKEVVKNKRSDPYAASMAADRASAAIPH